MVKVRILLAPPLVEPEDADISLDLDESLESNGLIYISEVDEEVLRFQVFSLIEIPPQLLQLTYPKKDNGTSSLQDGDCILVSLNVSLQSQCTRIFSLPDQPLTQLSAITNHTANVRICAGCASTCHPLSTLQQNISSGGSIIQSNSKEPFVCQCICATTAATSMCLFQERYVSELIPIHYLQATLRYEMIRTQIQEKMNGIIPLSGGGNDGFGANDMKEEAQMFRRFNSYFNQVKQYEDPENQKKAQFLIPHERLWKAVEQNYTNDTDFEAESNVLPPPPTNTYQYPRYLLTSQDERTLLKELLHWFKNDFFQWVNHPPCQHCHHPQTHPAPASLQRLHFHPLPEELQYGAKRVEIYQCPQCTQITRFPRYNSSSRLLDPDARRGRCGEWANAFTLIVRSMGFPARLMMDWTDHVWTEVWLSYEKRWCHLDSCEAALDSPLMYEEGWGKKLTYCMSFSMEDGVTDVIGRYTRNWEEVKGRRTLVSEEVLKEGIQCLSVSYRKSVEAVLRAELEEKELSGWINTKNKIQGQEQVEEKERKVSPEEEYGRQSGSKEWRLARGELGDGRSKQSAPKKINENVKDQALDANELKKDDMRSKVEQTITIDDAKSSKLTDDEIGDLTRLYFKQLTEGCSSNRCEEQACQNKDFCGIYKGNPNKAAISAFKVAMTGNRSRLCINLKR